MKGYVIILLIKLTAAQNEVALSYHRVRGLYFLSVIFAGTVLTILILYLLYCIANKKTHKSIFTNVVIIILLLLEVHDF